MNKTVKQAELNLSKVDEKEGELQKKLEKVDVRISAKKTALTRAFANGADPAALSKQLQSIEGEREALTKALDMAVEKKDAMALALGALRYEADVKELGDIFQDVRETGLEMTKLFDEIRAKSEYLQDRRMRFVSLFNPYRKDDGSFFSAEQTVLEAYIKGGIQLPDWWKNFAYAGEQYDFGYKSPRRYEKT